MATFPTTFYPQFGYASNQDEFVKRNAARAGVTQIKDMWNRTRFVAEMTFALRTDDALTVYGFWKQNRTVKFDFFDYDDDIFFTESIGTGDGSTLIFNAKAKGIRLATVYVAGVAKTAGTHYNISAGSGPLGQDRVIFTGGNAPANLAAVTISYTGKHLYSCTFPKKPEKTRVGPNMLGLRVSIEEAFS